MIIQRHLSKKLKTIAKKFPVIAILGPRQSGKTTIAKLIFKNHTYVSLEDLDKRNYAISDPRGFLKTYKNEHGIILDEIQHSPDLLSYIQTYVDENPKSGNFILTGSQNFLIHEKIAQTLAGRIFISNLLPLTIDELKPDNLLDPNIDKLIFNGFYPGIYSKKISPIDWYPSYTRTYIEKDVRQIKNITDLHLFQKFLKLCAGRIGQLLNYASLANDCGISINTIKSWISILEQSYIIFLLQPHFNNFSKRLVKMPKLYFYDTGFASSLLGIEKSNQISTHYLKGSLFESLIISDLIKQRYNKGLYSNLYFYRDRIGHEIDCIFQKDNSLIPIEIKAGQTINSEYFQGLNYWHKLSKSHKKGFVIYAGKENQKREKADIISWQNISSVFD